MKRDNRGKDFEAEIQKALESVDGVSIDRLPDPMGGYSGVRNIADYSVFHSPDMFYLECKSFYGNTLNYKTGIRPNQWDGMLEKSKIKRCVAGVCVWFIDYDLTVFVEITELVRHRESGAKSLNISDVTTDNTVKHYIIDGKKKRVMYSYFGDKFLKTLHSISDERWGNYGS